MGCDIHAYSEIKNNVGFWDLVGKANCNRDYSFFGLIAGVRDYRNKNQQHEVKGFPKNASSEVQAIYDDWGSDAHTSSYLTLPELKSTNKQGQHKYTIEHLNLWIEHLERYDGKDEDKRIVFWFDN